MSAPADALVVLDSIATVLECHGSKIAVADLREARAAVAELVEAVRIASNFDGLHTNSIRAMPFAGEAMTRLRVALARVGGSP